ncbi:MAG: alpha-ketoglutarate-dependent dioxygenase AlkB family protein [Salibacteraceae bacterium]
MSLFETKPTKISLPLIEGEGWYLKGFLSELEQEELKAHLWSHYNWEQPHLTVFGKSHPIPRMAAWVVNKEVGYDYSGIKHELQPWSAPLLAVKQKIELATGTEFNSVLLNAYRNGSDKMGWHSDYEKALGNDPLIASLNLGTARRFDLRNTKNTSDEVKIHLEPGSLLFMGSGIQKHYKHQVPQQKRVEGLRINLTFRKVVK